MSTIRQLSLMDPVDARPVIENAHQGNAVFSGEKPTPLYRYRLERELSQIGPTAAWLMINPSTATATEDDATIRKVHGFAARYGFGRFVVGNLFAWRATDIKALRTAADPIGPDNDRHLAEIMHEADTVIVAWGASAKLPRALRDRWRVVVDLAEAAGKSLHCIGTANDGHPLHPLMQGYDRPLVPWVAPTPTRPTPPSDHGAAAPRDGGTGG